MLFRSYTRDGICTRRCKQSGIYGRRRHRGGRHAGRNIPKSQRATHTRIFVPNNQRLTSQQSNEEHNPKVIATTKHLFLYCANICCDKYQTITQNNLQTVAMQIKIKHFAMYPQNKTLQSKRLFPLEQSFYFGKCLQNAKISLPQSLSAQF